MDREKLYIKKLPDALIDQIAAGEVIERPASVVKELVENSLDANAMNIEVHIQCGGRKEITVIDDGRGMSEKDLDLSVERFATSKISRIDDLLGITSYGFRGEALPSIASVSRMSLSSALSDGDGWEIYIEGGIKKRKSRTSNLKGCRISVKDLFYNIPARLKFLKTDATEKRKIISFIESIALIYFDRSFKVFNDGRLLLEVFARKKSADRLTELFGKEALKKLVYLEEFHSNLSIKGWLSLPSFTRRDRSEIRVYVNKRLVKSAQIISSLIKFYRDKIPRGTFPIAVLFVDIKPELIDVNVHPAKLEIRFLNEREVIGAIFKDAAKALSSSVKEGVLHSETKQDKSFNVFSAASLHETGNMQKSWPADSAASSLDHKKTYDPLLEDEDNLKVIGQAGLKYLLIEDQEGITLIDQHAAHERVLYEKLLKEARSGENISQKLLIPLTLELVREDYFLIEEYSSNLKKIGFDIEPFGSSSVIIHAVPVHFINFNTTELILKLAASLKEEGDSPDLEKIIRASCKQAVKFGDKLEMSELRELVKQLFNCESPYTCPHGRPLSFKLSYHEIDRKFGRN